MSRSVGHRESLLEPARDPLAIYESRRAVAQAERERWLGLSRRLANVSLALIAAALIAVALGFWLDRWWFVAAAALLVAFVVNYTLHGRVDRREQSAADVVAINEEGLLRLRRDWQALPLREPSTPPPPDSPAGDLDLWGRASLLHLLSTANTPAGQATLQRWLLNPAAPEVIRRRQAAVAELAALIDFRDALAQRGRRMTGAQAQYQGLIAWAEGPRWLAERPWIRWLSRVGPGAALALIVAQGAGWIGAPLWLVPVAINMGLSWARGGAVDAILDRVVARQRIFRAYADLFALVEAQSFEAEALRTIQQRLTAGHLRADQQLRRLGRRMPLADFRMFLFFAPIQWLTLWTFHVLWLLERWQRDAGSSVRRWLDALGELEALAALATMLHDHPDWSLPRIVEDGTPVLHAEQLGHPLLPPATVVRNDVQVGPPGTFLLVTGSNMSGKSTLLRAIGVNVALAQAGGPVCAARMSLPPVEVATCMRVQDSLEQGVSYFMAEIRRLKLVVDRAQAARESRGRALLYLLDEILHGTNTAERQVAARQVIRHLIDLGAIGAVSTHDLTLADAPDLAAASQAVHFTEQFTRGPDGPRISFDYRLRPGLATSTNALKLMEIVGLPVQGEELPSR